MKAFPPDVVSRAEQALHGYLRKQQWLDQRVIEEIGGEDYLISLLSWLIEHGLDEGKPMERASKDAINEVIREFRHEYDRYMYRHNQDDRLDDERAEWFEVTRVEPDPTADAVLVEQRGLDARQEAWFDLALRVCTPDQLASLEVHAEVGGDLHEGAAMLGLSRAAHKGRIQKGRERSREAVKSCPCT